MRNRNESYEEAMRRSAFQQDQDDISVHKVTHNGKEVLIIERRHEVKFIRDPEDE